MTTAPARPAGFWNRPATWKPLLLVVLYLAFYLAVSRLVGWLFADQIDEDDLLSSAASILLGIALPVALGGIALLVFTARVGWLGEVFGRQPVSGRRWMWIAPAIVLAAVVAHAAGTDWSSWTGAEIAAMAFLGACVGLTEELATRGLTVKMLRDAGHAEKFVALVSSLVFALMHTVNLLGGMSLQTVGGTVLYTFGFGMCMYLAMRVTGTIWAAIVLHALTDPTTFLATGGVDTAVNDLDSGALAFAGTLTVVLILFGVVAVFLVRGRVGEGADEPVTT